MVELTLELGVVVIAWLVSLVVALYAVPRLAGKKSEDRLVAFLTSDKAEPLWDKAAERVALRMEPKLADLSKVSIDAAPIVAAVMQGLGPNLEDRFDKLRAWFDGKKGAVSRALQDLGEGALEGAAAEAAERGELSMEDLLAQGLTVDPEWAKRHPYAMTGLRYLQRQYLSNPGSGTQSKSRANRPGAGGGRDI